MKRKRSILVLLMVFLTGCAATTAAPDVTIPREGAYPATAGGTAVTQSSHILQQIWGRYANTERFAVFGGDPQNFVAEGPGDLDAGNAAMLQQRFLLTPELTEKITEGAALEHLLNRNVFSAGVFRLKEGTDIIFFAGQLREHWEEASWTGGRPQRLLLTQPEPGFLLVAFGQTRVLETFLIRMNQAYPKGQILAYREIPQKTPPHDLPSADHAADDL